MKESLNFSDATSAYLLRKAVEEHKLTLSDLNRFLKMRDEEISTLEQRLAILRAVGTGTQETTITKRQENGADPTPARRRRKIRVTPEIKASRVTQGRYISMLRRFKPRQRNAFAKLARVEGREVAIKSMETELGKA